MAVGVGSRAPSRALAVSAAAAVVTLFTTVVVAVGAAPASAAVPANVHRVAGATRIETAVAASRDQFPGADSAKAVVLARSDDFPDALAGGPLAAKVGGPLLLTPSDGLDARVSAELVRVAPRGSTVYILGGTAAISAQVAGQIQALGDVVKRISGADRYATAVAIADQLGDPTTVFEATGLDFPDALAGGPAAIVTGGVVLLTKGSSQAPATANYLKQHPGGVRYALGGPAAAADPAAIAFIGGDRFETAAEVADQFFTSPTTVGLATGLAFPDAVAAGPDLASKGAPLLLAPGSGNLPGAAAVELLADFGTLRSAIVFGGPASVSDDVATQLGQLAGLTPATAAASTSSQWTGRYGVLSDHHVAGSSDERRTVVVDGDTGDATTYRPGSAPTSASHAYLTRPSLNAMLDSPGGFEQAVNAAYGASYKAAGYTFSNPNAEFAVVAQSIIEHPLASPTVRATVLVTLANLPAAHVTLGVHDSTGRVALDVWAPIEGNPQLVGDTVHYLFDPATATPLERKQVDSAGKTLDVDTYVSLSTTNSVPTNPYS